MKRPRSLLILLAALTVLAIGAGLLNDQDGDGSVGISDVASLIQSLGGPLDTTRVYITVRDTITVFPWGESTSPAPGPGQITIASWNIRIFSTGIRDDSELGHIADRLQQFDLIAIQELRDQEVIDRTLAILANRGHTYQAEISSPVGRGSSFERYAFLYRQDKISVAEAGQIWSDPGDLFIREPYVATFRAGDFDFTLISIHAIYGNSKSERRAEALLLDTVWQTVRDTNPEEQDVILLGDFNLEPDDEGFQTLRVHLRPLFTGDVRTTITETSLYDNIWIPRTATAEYAEAWGIDRFDQRVFGNHDEAASLAVSDHRPVWAKFWVDRGDDD